MKKRRIAIFTLILVFCFLSFTRAQNIPVISKEITNLIKTKEPQWKNLPYGENKGLRSTTAEFRWKFKSEDVMVSIVETKSSEAAAKYYQNHSEKEQIPNLGDENYVSWGIQRYYSDIYFRRGRMVVFVKAIPAETALRFARYIDDQIKSTVLTDKWAPGDTIVVEYFIEGKEFKGKLTALLEKNQSGGGGGIGSAVCGGCSTSSGYIYSHNLIVTKLERNKVFLKLSIQQESTITDFKTKITKITNSSKWEKEFSIPLSGITEKDLGDGFKIKAYIE